MMHAMDQHRYERVILETNRHRIEGTITMARDGYRSRLSDLLNASEREFLSLTDATVTPIDGTEEDTVVYPFVVVSRRQVVLAIPLDERPQRPGPSSPPPPPLSAV
jgi:hypothetical protein